MTFMAWSEDLSVGLQTVDEQHMWLVDSTNRLHEAVNHPAADSQAQRGTIGEILEGLMDYTMNHFVMEEELFQRHAYPGADAHRALHDQFTASVLNTLHAFEAGQEVGSDALTLLRNWLVEHIMKVDRAYAPFLAGQGVC